MQRLFLMVTLVWWALGGSARGQADSSPDAAPFVSQLTRVIEREVAQKRLPAFSIALVDDQRIVWAAGFGQADPEQGIAATDRTIYRVGSVSKLLTDVAVMQLVEEGRVHPGRDVRSVLTDFRPENPFGRPITLNQLMSHRSGLVRESPVGHYFDPNEPSLAETVRSLNTTRLVYPPGTRTKYSNAAVSVAGYVVERVTGVPFEEYMRTRLLRPLGMLDSDYAATEPIRERLATGVMWTVDGRRFDAPRWVLGTAPAGNLFSTVRDLGRFLTVLFNQGRLEDGRLLSPSTLQQMMEPQEAGRFGIGFALSEFDGHRAIGHGGAVYGFSTQLKALPDQRLGVVAVASLDGANGCVGRIADYALRLMLAHRSGAKLPAFPPSRPVPLELARASAGRYQNGSETVELTELSGRLFLRQGSSRREVRGVGGRFATDDVLGARTSLQIPTRDELRIGDRTFTRKVSAKPPPCPADWKGLIGEYGWDHNTLYILEDQGQLWALIEWFYYYPLTQVSRNTFAFPDGYGLYHGERLVFERDAHGVAQRVVAAEVEFVRREVGTRDGETFRIKPLHPIAELRARARAATPPVQPDDLREPQLVDVTTLDDSIKLDIRYATDNNFMGAVFYRQPRAFLQRPAAEALVRVHRRLNRRGYGLLIHDAYRPWYVTKMFWDATPESMKDFVANPRNGSRHNRGSAVDLTLYHLESGDPVQMVAGYDEFSPRSFPGYPGGTSRQRWYRELLREEMEADGFSVYEFEWWHFDYQDWERYPILNKTFEEIDPPTN